MTSGDLMRGLVGLAVLALLFASQRFWWRGSRRLIAQVRRTAWRRALYALWVVALVGMVAPLVLWVAGVIGSRYPVALIGMWMSSALFAYIGVQLVRAAEWVWHRVAAFASFVILSFRVRRGGRGIPLAVGSRREIRRFARVDKTNENAHDDPRFNPARRFFFQSATYVAGTIPFAVAAYGFFAERLQYRTERIEIPIPDLPPALDGLRIAQLSDIHIGAYMPRDQVRRAVDMANDLGADLHVVTGDFITGHRDPLEACMEELSRLHAPLGVWGCNGNHEIYADVEDRATELARQVGIRILRHHSAEVQFRGAALNLIGVDYQRTRALDGRRLTMLAGVESLVRSDLPNILLSHNPNAFPRAAELGIELTLAGHTHGGQVQIEILDRHISPARFMTPFVAGLYHRGVSLASSASIASPQVVPASLATGHWPPATASLYVNRGLGTVGTPVRFNAPPEITLITLRRA